MTSELTELRSGAIESLIGQVGSVLGGLDQKSDPAGFGTSGIGRKLGIACARFNGGITMRLVNGALQAGDALGVSRGDICVAWAPGAFELPLLAQAFAQSGNVDAVLCLGAVIRGETGHYDFVAGMCAYGIQRVQLDTGVPVVFGVLTVDTVDQALDRARDDDTNKGYEAMVVAVSMCGLLAAPVIQSVEDIARNLG